MSSIQGRVAVLSFHVPRHLSGSSDVFRANFCALCVAVINRDVQETLGGAQTCLPLVLVLDWSTRLLFVDVRISKQPKTYRHHVRTSWLKVGFAYRLQALA